jgi:flavin-dependent dehydrogenase
MNAMEETRYDVVVLGGAIAGASAALLLRRENPALRVLVVEKLAAFDEKVGEATTEMSGMFLTRRLRLWRHLENEHLPKEGLRYWFRNESVTRHREASEAGGFVRSTVPSFQLRRDALDEHVLRCAVEAGAELRRPARVRDVELGAFDHRVTIEEDGRVESVRCRWVLDATGRATFLGKKLGLIERDQVHPTAAIWCRWKNLKHIDDLAAEDDEFAASNVSSRRLATNHYMGYGSWTWFIPLGNGETSVGVVFDKRIVKLHEQPDKEAAFLDFLRRNPLCAELLEGAEHRAEDLRFYSHLPYVTRQYMGEGWALVGDAAAFLDPYYSPGLDHMGFTAEATKRIVLADFGGEDRSALAERIRIHNETFLRSYHRFLKSVYVDKYIYMGEADLLSASFLMDTAQYYLFVVTPAYRILKRYHWMPVLGPKEAFFAYHTMVLYNRRLRRIALARLAMGEAGRRNAGLRIKAFYNLDANAARMGLRGGKLWLAAELDYLRLKLKALFAGKSLAREIEKVTPRVEPERVPAAAAGNEIREPAA